MKKKLFLNADDVANVMGVSQSRAYVIIRQLNNELKAQGYLTCCGRIDRLYFAERVYGGRELCLAMEG